MTYVNDKDLVKEIRKTTKFLTLEEVDSIITFIYNIDFYTSCRREPELLSPYLFAEKVYPERRDFLVRQRVYVGWHTLDKIKAELNLTNEPLDIMRLATFIGEKFNASLPAMIFITKLYNHR